MTYALALVVALDVLLPPLHWQAALPPRDTCLLALSMNSEYRCFASDRCRLQTYRKDLDADLTEANRRRVLWDLAADVRSANYSELTRRLALHKLARAMGWRDIREACGKTLPFPVPLEKDGR